MPYDYFKAHAYDKTATVTALLEKSMAEHAGETAVVYNDRKLTYAEVDDLSGRIARFVAEKGIGRENVVSILLNRSEMMIVAAIGVIRAGAAYQPLDPSYPDERLSFMMEDAEAKLLITEDSLRGRTGSFRGDVLNIADIPSLPKLSGPLPRVAPEDLFVLLYTSGSTGVPKGVMLEQGNLVAFLDWYVRYYGIGQDSRVAAYASFGFDASMMDTYPVLTSGGQMHIIDEAIRMDFPRLHDYFERHGVTHSFITTQVGRQYAMLYPESKSLRCLTIGGETLIPMDPPTAYRLYNAYGPTECTILTSVYPMEHRDENVPIGQPLDNMRAYIVGEDGGLVETGEEGELVLAGPQIARGYLKRPEKTAEVFRKNPFSNEKGYERIYCTGDIVRGRSDGAIEFVGRRDGQVKIRGFRIELSEIEGCIRQFEGIRDATVAAFDKPSGGKYIAAYVVSDAPVDIAALHAYIGREKPPYMVPAVTMQIPSIPLNQNQKVDKRALPVPQVRQEEYEAPVTEMEKRICEKMAAALSMELVGVNDDFFAIGGDSVTSIRLILECAHPGVNTSSIFRYRTPRKLAEYCASIRDTEQILAENEAAMKRAFAPGESQRLYIRLQREAPESVYSNSPFFYRLAEDVDIGRFAAAVDRIILHHPGFLTTFRLNADGEYEQYYDRSLFRPIEIHQAAEADMEGIRATLLRPYPLTGEAFYRNALYRTETDTYFFMEIHHILFDGFSLQELFDEIYACYTDPDHELPPDPYYYFLQEAEEYPQTENYREAEEYYRVLFAGERPLRGEDVRMRADGESGDRKGAVRLFKTEIAKDPKKGNVFFLTACAIALARYNQTDRALIRFAHNGRDSLLKMSSIGLYASYYPVYLVMEESDTPATLLEKAEKQVEFANGHLLYPALEKYLEKPDETVRFIFQQNMGELGDFGRLVRESFTLASREELFADCPCGFSVIDQSGRAAYLFSSRYEKNNYAPESIQRFYELFLEAVKYLEGKS